jgi:hypothetical protein
MGWRRSFWRLGMRLIGRSRRIVFWVFEPESGGSGVKNGV